MKNSEIKHLRFEGWPLPDEYLVELGRIVALWTVSENLLNLFLGKLSGFELNDPKGVIIYNHLTIPQKMDILGCLVEQLVDEHPNLKEYPDALSKLRHAQTGRNQFVHSGLYFDKKSNSVELSYATARGKLKTKVENVSLVDFKRVVVNIAEANKALYKVVLKQDIKLPWET